MTSLVVQLTNLLGNAATSSDIYLSTDAGERVRFDVVAPESSRGGRVGVWSAASRPGRTPLSRQTEKSLKAHAFTALVGVDPEASIEARLTALDALAHAGTRVQFVYGAGEAGWWTITDLSVQILERVAGSNDASRAEVTFTLTEANAGQQAAPQSFTTRWRTHTVRKGDTLYRIAAKYLGRGGRWKEIAKANGIKNPKAKTGLKVGRRLRIPPK